LVGPTVPLAFGQIGRRVLGVDEPSIGLVHLRYPFISRSNGNVVFVWVGPGLVLSSFTTSLT
jgi:hypothetical protein